MYKLSLNAAAAVSADEIIYVRAGYEVEVAGNGVLERRSRYAEFKSVFKVLAVYKAADRTAGKGVAAAYAVYNRRDPVFS